MSGITVRYESRFNICFTTPFEVGMRHLSVAFCDGSQKTLIHLAKERIIFRPYEYDTNPYAPLTMGQRFCHLTLGLLETVGYITLVISFLVFASDKLLNQSVYFKGREDLCTHLRERGSFLAAPSERRKNPFALNRTQDPFYQGASWAQS